ncbi:MAG: uracil-DNA glycosylase family protein [Armatimonadota bacterium]
MKALAVASEPYIFWRGENVGAIVREIPIPEQLGMLEPADPALNGPTGIALDEWILGPLGLKREDAWLCDLVPHSCMNSRQRAAIARAYQPAVNSYGLPAPSVPGVPRRLATECRRQQILAEIESSEAGTLVLLGDQPIQWFLSHYDGRWHRLRDFGTDSQTYGVLHHVHLGTKTLGILPLAHPRQIARLGPASGRWYDLHQAWVRRTGPGQR